MTFISNVILMEGTDWEGWPALMVHIVWSTSLIGLAFGGIIDDYTGWNYPQVAYAIILPLISVEVSLIGVLMLVVIAVTFKGDKSE